MANDPAVPEAGERSPETTQRRPAVDPSGGSPQSPPAGAVPPTAFLVVVLAAVSAVPQLAIDMYLPGFPELARELDAQPFAVQLTLTAFLIGLAGGQLVFGPLSDQFGRRRLLLAGSAVCALATALCALAPTIEALIGARFLQGASGAAGVVLARAVLADRSSGRQAARLFSLMMAIQGLAPILAPLVGGALVPGIGWRGVFWVLTALSVVLWLLGLLFVHESLPVEQRRAGGVIQLMSLIRTVLRNRSYLGYCLAVGCGLGALFCYIAASPFILQETFGLGPGWFSIIFAANSGGLAMTSLISAKLMQRYSPARVMQLGLVLMLAGAIGYTGLTLAGVVSLWGTVLLYFLIIASLGFVLGNATALAVEQIPHAAGTAMAVIGAAEYAIGAAAAPLVGLGAGNLELALGFGMLACTVLAAGGGWAASHQRI